MGVEVSSAVEAAAPIEDEIGVARSLLARVVYATLGFVFLGVGIAGFYLPVLPGTINLLVAAYFFSMSSERMYRWMMTNRMFGQELRDYRAGLGIKLRVKVVAITSIILSVGFSVAYVLTSPWSIAGMVIFGLIGIVYILNQPTRQPDAARA